MTDVPPMPPHVRERVERRLDRAARELLAEELDVEALPVAVLGGLLGARPSRAVATYARTFSITHAST